MSQQKDSEPTVDLDKTADQSSAEPQAETAAPADTATEAAVDPDEPAATEESAESEPGKAGAVSARRKSRTDREEAAADEPESSSLDARKAVTLGSIALLALAGIAAAWFAGSWIVGGLLRDRPRAEARDEALAAAQQAAINITSMNLKDVDGSLALARSSMTGDLLDASTKNQDQLKQKVMADNVNISSKILGGALTELNSEKDHASALVVFQVTESGEGKATNEYRYTWSVDVVKNDGIWKADQVQQIANPIVLNSTDQGATTPQQPGGQPATPQPGN
ncbi:hypothetical protein H0264_08845 [Nocardia huaxiensis]|uniref:Mce-associated membrane protein n=1 Tax=Nocardia huaxiensis TaxID=2755382 RepID=A0A7D6VE20_9NOCA|nr:hypothetical protein [Nocardia huaxiensis]QLY32342.1 hypothetical protein H0264_08845 [Nocardia huaxiensis]